MNEQQERELFERKSVPAAVIRLALPTVIGQVILVIYNMADTFFVGLTGNDVMLAAVGVCMPAFMFLSAISNLFGIGGASLIARSMGAGNRDQAGLASSFALWGCLAVTAAYSLLACVFRDAFLDVLGGTDPLVHKNASDYLLCTVCAGGVIASASMLLSHLIRSEGRSIYASAGVALGGVMNIALDPLFMFVILPPGNEALGAAVATTLSSLISLVYFMAVLARLRKKSLLRFSFRKAMFLHRIPQNIFAAGLPACTMTLFENISYGVLDKLMSLSGLAVQAGIGVAKKVNMLAHCIVRGIAQGALPLIAYNSASGDRMRMRSSLRFSHGLAIGMAAVCAVISLLFARSLIGLFIRSESPSLGCGAAFLRILCIGAPFSASAYTLISFFQATGNGKKSFFLAILRKGLVDIPLMFLLGRFFPLCGPVAATPLADALCCLAAHRMYVAYGKEVDTSGIIKHNRKYLGKEGCRHDGYAPLLPAENRRNRQLHQGGGAIIPVPARRQPAHPAD